MLAIMGRRGGAATVAAVLLVTLAAARASPEEGVQPLSKIAIHEATVELQPSAYVRATPTLLGAQGEDTEWVTVKYGSPNPSPDDWIAVFSPANFNSGVCPNPSRYPYEPGLCTAPIKFQYANYSANYLYWGKGSMRLQLINQRYDFSFALFTGGVAKPKLIAVSKPISFKNPKAPVYPRLAQGNSYDEMTVTWTSGYDISEAYPFVEWGMVGSTKPTRTAAGTLTFNRGSMCGEPARTVGWRDPGFIHTAFMRDLWPNKEYYYKIGHELSDGSVVWGKRYTFRAPPFPGQNSLQRIIVFGDMGKAERDGSNEFANYQPGSLNTTDRLVEDLAATTAAPAHRVATLHRHKFQACGHRSQPPHRTVRRWIPGAPPDRLTAATPSSARGRCIEHVPPPILPTWPQIWAWRRTGAGCLEGAASISSELGRNSGDLGKRWRGLNKRGLGSDDMRHGEEDAMSSPSQNT